MPLGRLWAASTTSIKLVAEATGAKDRSGEGNKPDEEKPHQRLAHEIITLISRGELVSGDRLPSETVLTDRYKVSRTSIREAIIALEIRGMVEVRPASGIYVRR